jgi:hypothetical protein
LTEDELKDDGAEAASDDGPIGKFAAAGAAGFLLVVVVLILIRGRYAKKRAVLRGGLPSEMSQRYGNGRGRGGNDDDYDDDDDDNDVDIDAATAARRTSAHFRKNSVSIKFVKNASGAMTLVETQGDGDDDADDYSEPDSLDDSAASDDDKGDVGVDNESTIAAASARRLSRSRLADLGRRSSVVRSQSKGRRAASVSGDAENVVKSFEMNRF